MSADSKSRLSAAEWDDAVLAGQGHFLQSWRWGEFKSRFGWDLERVSVSSGDQVAVAQMFFRTKGPVSVGYIPRGPVVPDGDVELGRALFRQIDRISRKRRAFYTIVETERSLPFEGTYKNNGFVEGPERIQPTRTVKIPLIDDEHLLGQMRQNTRYSVRLAMRRGVEIVACGDGHDVGDFYGLLEETADRNSFGIHSRSYYQQFMDTFGAEALCIFARSDEHLAAGLISVRFGDEAIYMYGASSSEHRAHGAAFLLQFEAMKWARAAGCLRYDLWGIPPLDPENVSDTGDSIAGTKGDDWRGLYRFKTGFGGEIVSYPPALERRYNAFGAYIARRMTRRQRSDT